MTYTFRWRTGPLTNITEGEYTIEAFTLDDAVDQFKSYIATIRDETPFVVSYFYLVKSPEKMALGEFTDRYYRKHFGAI